MGNEKLKSVYEKISNVRNPVFVLENKSAIDVLIHHDDYGDIMFTAASYDIEEHGRRLWQELVDGAHGEIAPFVRPVISPEQIKSESMSLRDELLHVAAIKAFPLQAAINRGVATTHQQSLFDAWQDYAVQLLNLTEQDLEQGISSFPMPPSN